MLDPGAHEKSIWAGCRPAMSGCARGPRDRYACAKSTAFRSGWAGSRPVLPAGGRVEGAEAGLLDDEPELAAGLMRAIVYDTGALLAAERRNPDFLVLHDELTAARIRPIIPVVVVLPQPWRGGPQHQISRVLKRSAELPDAGAPAAPPASPPPPRVPPTSWTRSPPPPPSAT